MIKDIDKATYKPTPNNKITQSMCYLIGRLKDLNMTKTDFQRKMGIESQNWNNWRSRGIPKGKLYEVSLLLNEAPEILQEIAKKEIKNKKKPDDAVKLTLQMDYLPEEKNKDNKIDNLLVDIKSLSVENLELVTKLVRELVKSKHKKQRK